MIDIFGREITDNGDGSFTCGGITLSFEDGVSSVAVLNSFNGMAPEGWASPAPELTLQEKMQKIVDLANELGVEL